MSIDTQICTCDARGMPSTIKRTYNLRPRTIRQVREMAERYGVARSQDAVIELAVDELERRIRDEEEAVVWEAAAADPEFQAEAAGLEASYATADRETWPA